MDGGVRLIREHLFRARYHRAMNENKPVEASNVPTPTSPGRTKFLHEEIARRAEQIWEQRNRPSGSDEAIWLEAESQLQAEAESKPVAGTESRPYVNEP